MSGFNIRPERPAHHRCDTKDTYDEKASVVVDAQITFETDGKGPATALILHQEGQNPRVLRITD